MILTPCNCNRSLAVLAGFFATMAAPRMVEEPSDTGSSTIFAASSRAASRSACSERIFSWICCVERWYSFGPGVRVVREREPELVVGMTVGLLGLMIW